MLRLVLNAKRRQLTRSSSSSSTTSSSEDDSNESEIMVLEPLKDFLQRTAKWTDEQLEKANIEQWTRQWRRRKWAWAQKLADASNSKWSATATQWQPILHTRNRCGRRQARPKRRWEQDFVEFLHSAKPEQSRQWLEVAREKDWWSLQADAFAEFLEDWVPTRA